VVTVKPTVPTRATIIRVIGTLINILTLHIILYFISFCFSNTSDYADVINVGSQRREGHGSVVEDGGTKTLKFKKTS